MKKERLLCGLMVLGILSSFTLFKDIVEDFRARVSGYYHEKIGSVLFLHTDKSIYIPNESIWIKAYLLESSLQKGIIFVWRRVGELFPNLKSRFKVLYRGVEIGDSPILISFIAANAV